MNDAGKIGNHSNSGSRIIIRFHAFQLGSYKKSPYRTRGVDWRSSRGKPPTDNFLVDGTLVNKCSSEGAEKFQVDLDLHPKRSSLRV